MIVLFYFGIALTGAVMALFGGGGAMLCIPLLIYVGDYEPKQAIATGLIIVFLSSLVSLFRYGLRTKYVNYKLGLALAFFGMAGAFIGVKIYEVISAHVALISFASLMLVISFLMFRMRSELVVNKNSKHYMFYVCGGGFVVGLITGSMGASGGLPLVALSFLLLGLSMKESIATGLLVVVCNVAAALLFQYNVHQFNFLHTETWIAVSVAALSAFGVGFLFEKVKNDVLTKAFAVFVALIAIFILSTELLK